LSCQRDSESTITTANIKQGFNVLRQSEVARNMPIRRFHY